MHEKSGTRVIPQLFVNGEFKGVNIVIIHSKKWFLIFLCVYE